MKLTKDDIHRASGYGDVIRLSKLREVVKELSKRSKKVGYHRYLCRELFGEVLE